MESIWRQDVILKEVKKQLGLAGPLFAVGLLQYSIQLISVMFVGHLGELALSSASIATSFASVAGFNLLMGMASALDTLCGQSFGAEQHHMLGLHTQSAILVLSIISVFLVAIWVNTKSILIATHQDPEISAEAAKYTIFMIPSLFAYAILQCLVKFLQTQNNVFPMVLSSGITTLLHVGVCWTLVFKTTLGIKGAALANSVSYWINVLVLALYVQYSSSCAKTWTGFSKEALLLVFSFIRISIPSALMLCLKVWSFELMVLLSGLLPNPKLETSVLSISLNTAALVWMIPFGLSAAVSTRVSNELGARQPQVAKLAANVVLFMATSEGLIVGFIMIMLRKVWGNVYSNEDEVVKHVAVMMPILGASSFLDGIQTVLSGIFRGCGWQKIGACINLGSFYFVGVPVAVVLAFVLHMKAEGLWLGIVSAFLTQSILFLIFTVRTDWEKQANDAAKRVKRLQDPCG